MAERVQIAGFVVEPGLLDAAGPCGGGSLGCVALTVCAALVILVSYGEATGNGEHARG